MSIILFIVIIGVLIFIHELGHFLVAKKSGIRVDEFSIGFPPRIFSKKKGETKYSIGSIPFGGYVKIFGENPEEVDENDADIERSFIRKNRFIQALVVVAGVVFNIVFAWMLFIWSFSVGSLVPISEDMGQFDKGQITNEQVIVTDVIDGSPAELSGIQTGDRIISTVNGEKISIERPAQVSEYIKENAEKEITLEIQRNGDTFSATATPEQNIIESGPGIGISMQHVGVLNLSFLDSIIEGTKTTFAALKGMTLGLIDFIGDLFTNDADFDQIAGPVGIAGLVDGAYKIGFAQVLGFIALISINLAIINMIPFPALDGGRLIFIIIESIIRRPISVKVTGWLNAIGFLLLLALMVVLTVSDIGKLL